MTRGYPFTEPQGEDPLAIAPEALQVTVQLSNFVDFRCPVPA